MLISIFSVAWFGVVAAAPSNPVYLTADRLTYDATKKVLVGAGHANLHVDIGVIRADEIEYSQAQEVATARGNVQVISAFGGLSVAVASSLSLQFKGTQVKEMHMHEGKLLWKKQVSFETLANAKTSEELVALGVTTLVLSGKRVERLDDGVWRVHDVSMTPCDCDLNHPSWRIDATQVELHVRKGFATFLFPRVLAPFPILALPWAFLPLTQRQTGFLVPKPQSNSLNGFSVETPLYITLGESYDVTITPGYFFGIEKYGDGTLKPDGVKGPRWMTEFRYAPLEGTSGRVTFGILQDAKGKRDPVTRQLLPSLEKRGLRFEGSWMHQQDYGKGWFSRVTASAVSDGFYVSDLTPDVLAREAEYLRSTAVLARRADDSWLGIDMTLRQDLRWGYSIFGGDKNSMGPVRGPNTLQRLPALTWFMAERPLWGPISFDLRAEAARLAPILGNTGDEGNLANGGSALLPDGSMLGTLALRSRLFCPTPDCAPGETGQGDGVFQVGEREARSRLDVFPRLSASWNVGSWLRAQPTVAARGTGYFGEATGRFSYRAYPLLGLRVDSEVSRTFQEDQLRHAIAPTLELRYVPTSWGDTVAAYDAIDASLLGNRRMFQAQASVKQSWLRRKGTYTEEIAKLELGQSFNFLGQGWRENVVESYGRLILRLWPLGVESEVRYLPSTNTLTQVSGTVSYRPSDALNLYARYDRIHPQGSYRIRSGIDMLFGNAPLPVSSVPYVYSPEQVSLFAQWKIWKGVGVSYNALIARQLVPPSKEKSQIFLRQHTVGLSYAPACNCWKVEGFATQIPDVGLPYPGRDFIDWFGASFTIANLGTFGTSG